MTLPKDAGCYARGMAEHAEEPRIIQGGMGVAVSGWRLARAVSSRGQLGVVSGTALDVVLARRLQKGDPGGDARRALAAFPGRDAADEVLAAWFVPGGKPAGAPFAALPMYTASATRLRHALAVLGGYVEVFLAREGHHGRVGINFLEKIQLPPFEALTVVSSHGKLVVADTGTAFLVVILDKNIDLGHAELEIRSAVRKVRTLGGGG